MKRPYGDVAPIGGDGLCLGNLCNHAFHQRVLPHTWCARDIDIIALALNFQTKFHRPDSTLLTDETLQVRKFLGRAERKPLGGNASPEVFDGNLPAIRGRRMSPHASARTPTVVGSPLTVNLSGPQIRELAPHWRTSIRTPPTFTEAKDRWIPSTSSTSTIILHPGIPVADVITPIHQTVQDKLARMPVFCQELAAGRYAVC
jgi:hypothetical protein